VPAAARTMGRVERDVYRPDPARAAAYDELYAIYLGLHDHFGGPVRDHMHRLRALRRAGKTRGG
jgi:L-ribulokinase